MGRENPDQINSRLWQNDFDRDVPEMGGCGGGCLSIIFDLIIELFMLGFIICVIIAMIKTAIA